MNSKKSFSKKFMDFLQDPKSADTTLNFLFICSGVAILIFVVLIVVRQAYLLFS